MDKVRREIKDGQLVKEVFDPNDIEGFDPFLEHRNCQSPLAEISGFSFNEAGQLQGRTMPVETQTIGPSATHTRLLSNEVLFGRIF